jgi:hypothetical protein
VLKFGRFARKLGRESRFDERVASMIIPGGTRLGLSDLNRAKRQLVEMHYRARTGHLGGNLSAIDAMMMVHHELMGPEDRFVLSKGHAAGAYYVTLWSLRIISEAELYTFHADGTGLAGHPPAWAIPEIHFATGSLGHGLSLAAGFALAARFTGLERRAFCAAVCSQPLLWLDFSSWRFANVAAQSRSPSSSLDTSFSMLGETNRTLQKRRNSVLLGLQRPLLKEFFANHAPHTSL